jgi:hypothetical protein
LQRWARIPTQLAGTDFEATDSNKEQFIQYGFEGSYSIYCAQFSRRTATRFSGSIWHAFQGGRKAIPSIEIEEVVGHVFLGKKSLYSPYGPAQRSRVVPQKILGAIF